LLSAPSFQEQFSKFQKALGGFIFTP